jgi:micrococcal nuclease
VREARVRLLGIDTPETVKPNAPVEPWGPEATEFTKRLTAEGNVRLELDKRRIDRYGRSLAYVYVGDRLLNEELVRAGLARVSVYPGDSATIERRLRAAEAEARKAERGIWSTVQVTSSQ